MRNDRRNHTKPLHLLALLVGTLVTGCIQPVQIPQNVEFNFASTPTMIAHFPLNGDGTDTRGDLQLTRGPGDADSQSLQFQSGAPEVTGSLEHLFIPDQPNQFVAVRRQDDEEFVSFDESLSASFWFRPESEGTVLSIRQAERATGGELQIAQLEYVPASISATNQGTVIFTVGDNPGVGGALTVSRSLDPLEDGWYHVAFVINPFGDPGRAIALFLNGRRVLFGQLPGSLTVDQDELLRFLDIRLGAKHDGEDRFRGGISDLRFESIYLTGVQVAQQLLPEGAELPSHTVVFDSNGDSGTPPLTRSYLEGSEIEIPGIEGFHDPGIGFTGWNQDPFGVDVVYSPGVLFPVFEPATLFAQWNSFIAASFTFSNADGAQFSGLFPPNTPAEFAAGASYQLQVDPLWAVRRIMVPQELSSAVALSGLGQPVTLDTTGLTPDTRVYGIRVYAENTSTGRTEFYDLEFVVRNSEAMALVSSNQSGQGIGTIDLTPFVNDEDNNLSNDPAVIVTIAITGSAPSDPIPDMGEVSFSLQQTAGLDPSFGYDFDAAMQELSFEGPLSAANDALNSIQIQTGSAPPNFSVRVSVVLKEDGYFLNPVNGHFYQFVPSSGIRWDHALRDAGNKEFRGVPGHLVTITSEQENDFVSNNIKDANNVWIAATDKDEEGRWIWEAGPEAGTHFWQGATDGKPVDGRFSNWNFRIDENGTKILTEPNNAGGNEHYAVTNVGGIRGRWNDLPVFNAGVGGYIVEYSLTPDNPRFDGTFMKRVLVISQ